MFMDQIRLLKHIKYLSHHHCLKCLCLTKRSERVPGKEDNPEWFSVGKKQQDCLLLCVLKPLQMKQHRSKGGKKAQNGEKSRKVEVWTQVF